VNISRRNFLGIATGCAGTLWSFQTIRLDTLESRHERALDCVVLDLNSQCVLRESLQGYQAALMGEHSLLPDTGLDSRRCQIVIVPGLGAIGPTTASKLTDLLEAGTHVLLESGAGFLRPAEFTAHQRMLHRHFGIVVGPPVDLWAGDFAGEAFRECRPGRHSSKMPSSHVSVPYVNYLWPREIEVRDFSRVIPVSASAGEVIGKVGALPVALRRRMAKGALIFLGSPLGPALRTGDTEAISWLRAVIALGCLT
jgi:hypothetical protein